jgi:hypothetical protein
MAQLSRVFIIYLLNVINTERTKLASRYISRPARPFASRFFSSSSHLLLYYLNPSSRFLTLIGEGHIFHHRRLRLAVSSLLAPLPGNGSHCLSVKEEHPVSHYLRPGALLPVLALPATGVQPALGINTLTFGQILVAILS